MGIFDNITIDEHLIVSAAFFVCIGLIVKFFGAKIIKGLETKKESICAIVNQSEDELKDSQIAKDQLIAKESLITQEVESLMLNAEKEKQYIIDNAQIKHQKSFDQKIANQESINQRIREEKLVKLNVISWNSAVNLLKNTLTNQDNKQKHSDLIDRVLSDVSKIKL